MALKISLLVASLFCASAISVVPREAAFLQNWEASSNDAKDTPVTRVVNLLKEMSSTLQKEMEEDEELFDKLACWCNNNQYEKNEAVEAAEAKIAELTALIESLTAKSAELKEKIKELEEQVASDKQALAEATAIREKQKEEFHGANLDAIQGIENLKAALEVLGRHHGAALPQLSISLLSVDRSENPMSKDELSLDSLMQNNGFDGANFDDHGVTRFLQQHQQLPSEHAASRSGWSSQELATVRKALKSAQAFVQDKQEGQYYPSYAAQSGQIVGILKQLKEEMEGDLGEAQKIEAGRAAAFAELREAKTASIEAGEKMAEQKEDELAETDNALAEAKEDLEQTEAQLSEDQKFLANLKKTCSQSASDFNERKNSRLEEIKAVSETIEILTSDDAKDTFRATFSLAQVSMKKADEKRRKAAAVLRKAASNGNPALLSLATAVELDAFTKVKAAIDQMIAQLKQQQDDEVKKNDWCKAELQQTEMDTMKTEDLQKDLEAKIGTLSSTIETLTREIEEAKAAIAQLQVDLQAASETRKAANLDFQNTIAEQRMTMKVLKLALERLAKFYDAELVQKQSQGSKRQTPPVPQMEFSKSKGSSGVMSMIEKLIYDAKDLEKVSLKGEQEEQAQYEATIADTNASVANLMKEITDKEKAKAEASKDKIAAEGDLSDAVAELERLSKYTADLHAECDYVLKNFDVRQQARGEEIEALQQAKSILSGADFS